MNAFIIFAIIMVICLLVIGHMIVWTKMDVMVKNKENEKNKLLYEILNAIALVIRCIIVLISVIIVCLLVQGSVN